MDVRLILAGQRSTRAARLSPDRKRAYPAGNAGPQRGKIVTVDALCEALWGDNPFGYENSLNAHVRRIREKLKPILKARFPDYDQGLGYKLITRK